MTTTAPIPVSTRIDAPQAGTRTPDIAANARIVREEPTHPVPEAAKGPAIGKDGYAMEELGDGVIAVDAPPTLGNNILRGISKVRTPGRWPRCCAST